MTPIRTAITFTASFLLALSSPAARAADADGGTEDETEDSGSPSEDPAPQEADEAPAGGEDDDAGDEDDEAAGEDDAPAAGEGADDPAPAGGAVITATHRSIEAVNAPDLVVRQTPPRYPSVARETGVTGTVRTRGLVDVDGRIVRRKDQDCPFQEVKNKPQARRRFHPRLCIEAVSGPEVLWDSAVQAVADGVYRPFDPGSGPKRYWIKNSFDYKLLPAPPDRSRRR